MAGRNWDSWPQDDCGGGVDDYSTPSSSSSSTVSSGTTTPIGLPSSPSQSPLLVRRHHPSSSDDVMKLPRKDMKIFGECPVRDDFMLVVCDMCGHCVKVEAFETHCRIRHDIVGNKSRAAAMAAAVSSGGGGRRVASSLKSCAVDLNKDDLFPLSSSSSSATAEHSAATTMASSPAASVVKDEPMEDLSSSASLGVITPASSIGAGSNMASAPIEEADSTTANNVISIPDTGDPLPAMSNELMAMVSGEPIKGESGPNTPSSAESASASGGSAGLTYQFGQGHQGAPIKIQINPPPPPPPPPGLPTQPNPPSSPLTTSDSKKNSPGKKSLLAAGSGTSGGGMGRVDRKVQREYNPDKHCGVWDNDSKRHCTRALTCKSHSVLLKRKIPGRSKSFDDLVQQHKAQKEAQQMAAAAIAGTQQQQQQARNASRPPAGVIPNATVESVLSSITEPNPIDPRFSPMASVSNGMRSKVNPTYASSLGQQGSKLISVATTASGSKKSLLCLSSPNSGANMKESDENVIYTTDHPKPLAVCTFGGRRVGGLLVTDRSQFLTRKVVRVAITAGGFHRVRPQSRLNELKYGNNIIRRPGGGAGGTGGTTLPTGARIVATSGLAANNYLVNYNLAPNVVQQPQLIQQPTARVIGTAVTVAGGGGGPAPPNLTLTPQLGRVAVNLAPLPPTATMVAATSLPPGINIATTSDASFKTDIQDFKGGIKFELGRNMKPILPSGGEVSK